MVDRPILLVGRDGQVAWELRRTLASLGHLIAVGRTSTPGLDLTDPDSIRSLVQAHKPGLIVNAAAYTAVDKAEQEPDLAYAINARALAVLAEEARAIHAGLVHYSTDYVFPGDGTRPYREAEPTGPLGIYGDSKLKGEDAIRQSGVPHLILRTAWVYGGRGQNFLLTMLRLMRDRESLGIVNDQLGAPTWSRLIAEGTALALAQCRHNGTLSLESCTGTYHLTAAGETSWFGFASRIRELAIARGLLDTSAAILKPINTTEYPTPAKRPAYSVLSNQKLAERFGIALPDWGSSLELCLADMSVN